MPSAELVANNEKTTMLGGITGKGFMPGQSGNPKGRPKELIGKDLREQLEADPKLLRKVTRALIRKACKGDVYAFNSAADRVDGPVPKASSAEGAEAGGITINIRHIGICLPESNTSAVENKE